MLVRPWCRAGARMTVVPGAGDAGLSGVAMASALNIDNHTSNYDLPAPRLHGALRAPHACVRGMFCMPASIAWLGMAVCCWPQPLGRYRPSEPRRSMNVCTVYARVQGRCRCDDCCWHGARWGWLR